MNRQLAVMAGAVTLAVAAVLSAVMLSSDVIGRPVPFCGPITVWAKTDAQMEEVAAKLRDDPRIRALATMTKTQNYERFKEMFKDQEEIASQARPDSLPASVEVTHAVTVAPRTLADELRTRFAPHKVDFRDMCEMAKSLVPPTT